MHITRRSALKQLFIISAGAAILPSCVGNEKPASQAFSHIPLTAKDEEMLAEIASVIIPTTDTPGAKEVSAHLFALRMINDCYKKDDQEKFLQGFTQFRDKAKQQFSKAFVECSPAEKQQFISTISGQDNEAAKFYQTFKRLTIQAYTSSEYYLTKVDVYKLVPGKFISSVKVSPLT